MRDKVTIIIPTHNRPLLIGRAVAYYGTWDCRFIICDSSPEIKKISKKNIDHMHYPGEFFSQKIKHALELVTTPFVSLCADDDFLSESGVMKGIDFLEKNKSYVSVQGRYVQFLLSGNSLSCVPLYTKVNDMDIDSEDPETRIFASARLGMHQTYSLHRTEILQSTFSICDDQRAATLTEFSSNLVGMFYGKHKMLPMFWMARDAARYTEYNYNQSNANTVVRTPQLRDFLLSDEGKGYKQKFVDLFSKITGISKDRGYQLFDEVFFNIYMPADTVQLVEAPPKSNTDDSVTAIKPASHGTLVRSIIPKIVLNNTKTVIKSLIPAKLLGWLREAVLPFPLDGDPVYKKDWDVIVKVIKKQGAFPTVSSKITS